MNTAAQGSARTVRVQVVTPPGVLSRAGQKQLVAEATEIVARISGDPSQAGRTWVLLTEAAEGGWGIAGTAFGKEEFAALAAHIDGGCPYCERPADHRRIPARQEELSLLGQQRSLLLGVFLDISSAGQNILHLKKG